MSQYRFNLTNYGKSYIYYKNSFLLTQLRYYPYIQFSIISIFLLIAYTLFSTSRNSEQNKVWMGMAKETPSTRNTAFIIISLVEILKSKEIDSKTISEMSKDVERLEKITERFSKIGSPPNCKKKML